MKIKINRFGLLRIYRRDEYRDQYCPFESYHEGDDPQKCGQWCPLFNIEYKGVLLIEGENKECYELQLCHRKYQIESIEYE